MDLDALPPAEFAFPGPLRDRLVRAILSGAKTSTTGLLRDYEVNGEALPRIGDRQALLDSGGQRIAVIETTGVEVVSLGEVGLTHVLEEGEGDRTIAEWRGAHERFWHSPQMRAALGEPNFVVDDTTMVVLERFRVVHGVAVPPVGA